MIYGCHFEACGGLKAELQNCVFSYWCTFVQFAFFNVLRKTTWHGIWPIPVFRTLRFLKFSVDGRCFVIICVWNAQILLYWKYFMVLPVWINHAVTVYNNHIRCKHRSERVHYLNRWAPNSIICILPGRNVFLLGSEWMPRAKQPPTFCGMCTLARVRWHQRFQCEFCGDASERNLASEPAPPLAQTSCRRHCEPSCAELSCHGRA